MPTLPREIAGGTRPYTESLRSALTKRKLDRPLIVTGKSLSGRLEIPAQIAGLTGTEPALYLKGRVAGTFDVRSLVELLWEYRPDCIVSIGGGGAHDLAKAANAAYSSQQDPLCLAASFTPPRSWTFPQVSGPCIPHIAIPTTFSGSEANGNAGFVEEGEKQIISSPRLVPECVVVDVALYRGAPKEILAGSLFNALNHCIESMCSQRHGLATNSLLPGGAAVIAGAMRRPVMQLSDAELRDCAVSSAMISVGQSGSMLGIGHSAVHVLGAKFDVGHGVAHALLAGPAVRYNARCSQDAHRDVCDAIGIAGEPTPSDALAAWLDARRREHFGKLALADVGIGSGDLEDLARAITAEPGFHLNPCRVSHAELDAWLAGLL